jgi:F-type H+-transporting ATPase subunit epsilon
MATLHLEIVTPESQAYSGDVEMVVLPGAEGEMGILPMHVPFMLQLKPGELVITKGGQQIAMAIGEGFAEITQDHVSVLTEMAIEEQHIDESAVQEAIKRAETAMGQQHLNDEELATVQASIQRSLAQLHVKRRRHQ